MGLTAVKLIEPTNATEASAELARLGDAARAYAGGVSLLAAAISPVFFTGDRRYGYARRREVTA